MKRKTCLGAEDPMEHQATGWFFSPIMYQGDSISQGRIQWGYLRGGVEPQWRPNEGRGIQEQSPGGGPGQLLNLMGGIMLSLQQINRIC